MYRIIFSTYVNTTGQESTEAELLDYLNKLSKRNGVEGYTLRTAIGYWAGVNERSFELDLIEVDESLAQKLAGTIKKHFKQDAVILQPVQLNSIFI